MTSAFPFVVPWVSHHHTISKCSWIPLYPSAAYGGLGETSERQPHDTTRRPDHRRTRTRSWYIWKRMKHAQRGRQYIKKRKTGVTYACGKGRMLPEDHKQRNNLSLLPLSFQMAWSQIDSLLAFFAFFVCCVFRVYSHMYTHCSAYAHIHGRRVAISSVS